MGGLLGEHGRDYRYRYAVLCGGEVAVPALRTARLDPSDSDEPGPRRRVALAKYADCDDFLYRLPMYLGGVIRDRQLRVQGAGRRASERAGPTSSHAKSDAIRVFPVGTQATGAYLIPMTLYDIVEDADVTLQTRADRGG